MTDVTEHQLRELARRWAHTARCKFKSAEEQPPEEEFGKRFIEHGAMCYYNCYQELEQLLDTGELGPSRVPKDFGEDGERP